MEMIEKLRIKSFESIYVDYDGAIRYSCTGGQLAKLTGWLPVTRSADGILFEKKSWYVDGRQSTAMEVFDTLSDEDRFKAIWELNEWK